MSKVLWGLFSVLFIAFCIGVHERLSFCEECEIEVLASGESNSKWRKGFTRKQLWYPVSYSEGYVVSLSEIGYEERKDYKSMICCVNSDDMDYCDFSKEDAECERRVTRKAH